MYRKIIMNLLIGLLLPIVLKIRWLPNVYDAFFKGVYKYYDFRIGSLGEFLYYLYGESYFLEYMMLVIIILLPFQVIKDIHFSETGRGFSFLKKGGILSSLMIVWTLILVPIGFDNLTIFIFVVGIAVFFTALLHVAIDRYVEKQ